MKKIKFRILILTTLLCLAPIILGITFYQELPSQIAVHFNMDNQPDSYATKNFALFGIPIILTLLQITCCVLSDLKDPMENKKSPKIVKIVKFIIPVLGMILYLTILGIALEQPIDARKSILWALGIIFMVIGNYLPKTNGMIIRTNVFKQAEEQWQKLNRLWGYTYVVAGILLMITIFLEPIYSAIVVGIVVITIIVEMLYVISKTSKQKQQK
ncbi:MAG: DUF1648 domain-containing protein [Clostridia bacterium]